MAEAKAQPDRQQREAWGDSGPSVGERLFYLDTRINGQVSVFEGVHHWYSSTSTTAVSYRLYVRLAVVYYKVQVQQL